MNCFDCRDLDVTAAAVAVCRSCGAGICDRHAHPHPQVLHRAAGMGTATRRQAARRLLCATCTAAEHSG
ncbi:DUF2180 family protein [Streptomyces sp. NPDC003656]|uniref:DUF2180 family protein n=1 Tax=unclassified Streptomyces TaxID=2593676 RepID=UPI0018F4443E|nr:DUF2180 family protein [Streptomyces sp. DSM 110735]MBJ7903092.1 DUF2180 family protein [Streptomyces sp. DSM 110735]